MCNSTAKNPYKETGSIKHFILQYRCVSVLWVVLVLIHNLDYKNKTQLSESCLEILKYLNMISKLP